eukprot:1726924-Rhodomonas_salina.2
MSGRGQSTRSRKEMVQLVRQRWNEVSVRKLVPGSGLRRSLECERGESEHVDCDDGRGGFLCVAIHDDCNTHIHSEEDGGDGALWLLSLKMKRG